MGSEACSVECTSAVAPAVVSVAVRVSAVVGLSHRSQHSRA